MNYSVRVLKMGQTEVPGPEVYWMNDFDRWETLYFYMVVIQGGGKTAIINTGPPADLTEMNQAWTSYGGPRCRMIREEHEKPVAALAAIGVRPEQVDYVLITPLQSYATANIPLFRNAQICISRRGWIEDFHLPKIPIHFSRTSRIPNDVLAYLEIEAPQKVRLLKDDDEILPGLRARWVGTHHRSSMAYMIETAKGRVIASDAFFKYDNVTAMRPLGIQESMEECYLAYIWIQKEADILLPMYEPLVMEKHPGGVITED
jgi:glyoxylase-like metal-dependent hydrolase (beta-lactamase superfamily II)